MLIVFCPLLAHAQDSTGLERLENLQERFSGPEAAPEASKDVVQIRSYLRRPALRPGGRGWVGIELRIAEGWHLNGHRPTFDYLIGTTVQPRLPEGLIKEEVRYPAARELDLAFAGEPIAVYTDTTRIFYRIRVAEDLSPGSYAVRHSVRLQACNDQLCLPPSRAEAELTVSVKTGD